MVEQPVKNTITWRCVILALVLIPPNAYWSVDRGLIWGGPPATLSLLAHVKTVCKVMEDMLIYGHGLSNSRVSR